MNKIPFAVLDTNVIYPIEIRDFLFWLAYNDCFNPLWSKHIFEEWEIVMRRKEVDEKEIIKRISWANQAFPFAMVEDYEYLIENLELPDEKDCHVLAAAIESNAQYIVTNNLKDFPKDYLAKYNIIPISADDFILQIIISNPLKTIHSFKQLVKNRRNPKQTKEEILVAFERNKLKKVVMALNELL